uniref:Uroplakin-3b-like protein n=1 Tax=Calidris pygmaea TaxID=425635 RepID=A0A8C3KR94_9CHAR
MLPLLLLLLTTAHGLGESTKPNLTDTFLGGRTTASTFVLEQPRCVFTKLRDDTVIWLVVALPEGRWSAPGDPGRKFQEFPNSSLAYMTLNTTILNYPCDTNSRDITVLRVGSETSCAKDASRPTCNGPLPGPGPYQVKFLALDGSEPVAQTEWSNPIFLRKGTAAGVGHSAGMIALTAILSVLFAVLLAGLVAMLLWGSTFSKPEVVSVRRYNTHHVYDQTAPRL